MQRVIEEMAKAKSDVEKRYREKLPQIIRECMAFAYLGKSFRFDANSELDNRVNKRLVELGDEILVDIETRAKKAIKYAEEEDDEDAILAYIKREQDGEDLITRIDKHNSNFRYFLEGWVAIGIVNGLSQTDLINNIFLNIGNPLASDFWKKSHSEGYLSNSIRTMGYHYGKGIIKNPIDALTLIEQDSINSAFQYGNILKYRKDGAIGYQIHRGSSFDCPFCDSNCGFTIPLDDIRVPQHPRCVCWTTPVYKDNYESNLMDLISSLRNMQRKTLRDPLKGKAFADVTGGLATMASKTITELVNAYYDAKYNAEKVKILKEIVAKPDFKKLSFYSSRSNSIYSVHDDFAKGLKQLEMPKNLRLANKYVNNGYDVHILPNIKGSKSADFIIKKKDKLVYVEGKEFDGKNTLGLRIKDGATQSETVVVDVVGNQNTSYVFSEVRNAFRTVPNLMELHLFKGNRLIYINRNKTTNDKKFEKYFKTLWDAKK